MPGINGPLYGMGAGFSGRLEGRDLLSFARRAILDARRWPGPSAAPLAVLRHEAFDRPCP
jgi:hypothetical protein